MKKAFIKEKNCMGIFSKKHSIDIPQSWEELSESQFIAVSSLYFEQLTEEDFLHRFFDLKKSVVSKILSFQLYILMKELRFCFDIEKGLSSWFVSKVCKDLRAPEDMLGGMSFQQFMTADTFFSRYAAAQMHSDRDLFIASLYLSPKEGFVIESSASFFSSSKRLVDLERRASEVSKIDDKLKNAIFFNFVLIKKWLATAYKHLFPSELEDMEGTGSSGKPFSWLDVFDQFVGENIPDMDRYQAMPCMDAFRIINRRISENKKLLRKYGRA